MSTVLLNHLQTVFTPSAITKLAQALGEPITATQKAIDGLLPAITSGVINRSADEQGGYKLYQLLQTTPFDRDPNVSQLVVTETHRQRAADSGNALLRQLFDERAERLAQVTGQYSGIRTGSAQTLTGLVMSVLMGFLHQQITARTLTQVQLAALLEGEAASTRSAIPAALTGLLGWFIGTGMGRPTSAAGPIAAPTQVPEEDRPSGLPAWLKWLLAALGLLLFFLLMRSCNQDKTSATIMDPSASVATDTLASDLDGNESATGESAVSDDDGNGPDVRVAVDLPGGRKLNVAENSFNYSLAQYLAAKNSKAPKVFTFDNLTFEINSARITAKARPHVDDLIQIMQAYPDLTIRIEGNTDSTGDEAINDPLSAQRAQTVKAELVKAGVDARRITTRELGDTKPVASNQTPTGRQKNRRIDVVVTNI